ncbi:ras-related protein Rab-1A-like isoform X2 [Mya arenaria]|uniref:ras-related protein Rab-1A-like isoform X2 n=1 Tax=Mya arenaria TaxID=6604 RepID=UPI0022E88A12|nr:ras-related protein Rab-1A-like isoform X2 [Mya arenaria]
MTSKTENGKYVKSPLENKLSFKLLIIGDRGVGKTSLQLRFCRYKTVTMNGKMIKLQIWDTAGQEHFHTLRRPFYRGTHGVIIVFDLTDMETFQNVERWTKEVEEYGESHVVKLIVGNKLDLKDKRVVTFEMGKELADRLGAPYFETSALASTHVKPVFMILTAKIKQVFEKGGFTQLTDSFRLSDEKPMSGNVWDCGC